MRRLSVRRRLRVGDRFRFVVRGQLQEDLFQTHADRAQLIQVPAGLDHGARQLGADFAALQAFDGEADSFGRSLGFLVEHAADAGAPAPACSGPWTGTGVGGRRSRGPTSTATICGAVQAAGQVLDGVGGHQLALGDDDDPLAHGFHFRQDVGGKNNGVVAGQAFDQLAGFEDLVRIEAGGGLVQHQDVGIVQNRLSQADALAVAFGELADFLLADIGDGALLHDLIDAFGHAGLGKALDARRRNPDTR